MFQKNMRRFLLENYFWAVASFLTAAVFLYPLTTNASIDSSVFQNPELLQTYLDSGELVKVEPSVSNNNSNPVPNKNSVPKLTTDPLSKNLSLSTLVAPGAQSASAPTAETTPSAQDSARIELNLSVSKQSGSFNYSYPIELPAGRAGLTPKLALEYSSQSNDYFSSIGYGWSINIPVIERVNRNGAEKLYKENMFSSSIDGDFGFSSSSSFKPKVELGSFNLYTFVNGIWSMFDKKGTKYTYGSTTNSRLDNSASTTQVAKWYLNEIQDPNGNKITFTYFKDAGQIYPETVEYSFVGSVPLYRVVFDRSTTSARSNYKNSFQSITNFQISNINVYFNNVIVKNYKLEFLKEGSSNISLLSSIQETGLNEQLASTTLPKNSFTYTTASTTLSLQNNSVWAASIPYDLLFQFSTYPGGFQNTYYRTNIIDMNGDGLQDWVVAGNVYLNTGIGWEATSSWPILLTNEFYLEYRLVDVNGDALPDIIRAKDIIFDVQITGQTNSKIREVYLNNGDGSWVNSPQLAQLMPHTFYIEFWKYPGGIDYYTNTVNFTDMNGDGLSDWISGTDVYLNNGQGWSTTTKWSNLPASSFDKVAKLADVNGDGLPDITTSETQIYDVAWNQPTINIKNCYLNKGDGTWVSDSEWSNNIPAYLVTRYQANPSANPLITYYYRNVYLADITGDGLVDWYDEYNLYPNTGRGWSSVAQTMPVGSGYLNKNYRLEDVNGDTLLDFVRSDTLVWDYRFNIPTTVQREILLNQGKKSWLLATTTNVYGGTTSISYRPTPSLINNVIQNPISPYVLYTVASVESNSGVGLKNKTDYSFSGGDLYTSPVDVFARKFAGFQTVIETTDLGKTKTYYHQGNTNSTTSNETGDDYNKIGQAYRTEIYDTNNNLYQTTANLFATSSIGTSSVYTRLSQSAKLDYDGDADRRDSAVSYTYDGTNGNVLTQSEWGEVTANQDGTFTDTGTDKRVTTYTYASNAAAKISGTVRTERLNNQSGTKVKETRYYYDNLALGLVSKGNVTKKEEWATSTTYINTQSSYNSFGLKTQDLDPRGSATNYTYDSFNLYPATTTNALSQSTRYFYDYSSGKVKKIIDLNQHESEYVYDGLDRLLEKKETIPVDFFNKLVVTEKNTFDDTLGKVSVQNRKYLNDFDSVVNYSYLDGFGRKIQERKEAENPNKFSVSDTVYGTNNLVAKESLPYFSSGVARTSPTNVNNLYTNYAYDVLGRKTGIGTLLGTTTIVSDQWQEIVTDTLNNQNKNQYDAYGRLISVQQINGTSTLTTTYSFSSYDQLTKINDPAGNFRNFTYDGLGRRLNAEDLHASGDATFGVRTNEYDSAGNLATTTDPKGQIVVNSYDSLNRLISENFTGVAGIEATYTYDSCFNGVGRLCTVVNTQANVSYDYIPSGQIQTETKIVNGHYMFIGKNFDFQNNPIKIYYPSGIIISNLYNGAGQLERIEMDDQYGNTDVIVSDFDYGPHGMMTEQLFGNGALTVRSYDENELYRLRNISSFSSSTQGPSSTGGPGEEFSEIQNIIDLAVAENGNQNFSKITDSIARRVLQGTLDRATSTLSLVGSTSILENTNSASTSIIATLSVSVFAENGDVFTQPVFETQDPALVNSSTNEIKENIATSAIQVVASTSLKQPVEEMLKNKTFAEKISLRLMQIKNNISTSSKFIETSSEFNLLPKKSKEKQLLIAANKIIPSLVFKEEVADAGLLVTYHDIDVASSSIFAEKFVRWQNSSSTKEVNVYPLDPKYGMELGGFEMEVVLSEKPQSNSFNFVLANDESYKFVHQSPLTDEEIKIGKFIPENIIGSYEVFSGNKKFLQIFRPKAHDAMGKEVWGEMVYRQGNLEVIIPKDFLDTAVYPVVVDPTFGNTNYSSSAWYFSRRNLSNQVLYLSDTQIGTAFTATSSGPLTSVTALLRFQNVLGNVSLGVQVYEKGAFGTSSHRLVGSSVRHDVNGESPYGEMLYSDWYTFYFATGTIEAGKQYILSIKGNAEKMQCNPVDPSTCGVMVSYENLGGSGIYMDTSTFSATFDPWNKQVDTYFTSKFSMYASYENLATTTISLPTGSTLQNLTYTYDSVGNITKIIDKGFGTSATTTFVFDPLYRLTRASTTQALSNPYLENYSYNSLGNLTSKSGVGTYSYQGNTGALYANPHAPTTINGITYNYDRSGNLASTTGGVSNVWDYKNLLLSTKNGSATTTYTYDANGQRVSKNIGGVTTSYGSMFYEVVDSTSTEHIYAGGQLIASIVTAGLGLPKTYFVHPDHLGSTNVVTNSTGSTTSRYVYYPYGAVRNSFGTTTFNEPNQYIGQDRDSEADLNYLNARYYQSNQGQFTSQDPVFLGDPKAQDLKNPQNLNSYSYGTNNPIVNKDPEGEASTYYQQWNMMNSSSGGYLNRTVQAQITGYTQAATFVGKLGLSVAPGTGDLIAAREAYTGQSFMDGGKLSWGGRALAALSTVPGAGAPADASRGYKAASAAIHGNSLMSPKLTYGYKLVDRDTDAILKFGITSNNVPLNRYSRPQYDYMNAIMVPLNRGSRIDMRSWETSQIRNYELMYGTRPPLNKNYR